MIFVIWAPFLKVRLMQKGQKVNIGWTKNTETNNQNAEMLKAEIFPVFSVNSWPTHPALGVPVTCVRVCACTSTHICVGVRPPLGVCGPVRGSLWGTDPHLFTRLLFPAAANGQPPSHREETPLEFQMEPTSYWGPTLRYDLGWPPRRGGILRISQESLWKHSVNQRQRGGCLGENQGGVKGAQPAQDMAPSAWDDSTAKHLFPGKTSTSALPHKPIGSFNYSLDGLFLSARLI